ncbi:MAG: hypothetical protein LBU17_13085 [Treponema sp.]|jgi:hypothetical protein|nr:hypothetical protein [Treponema sp.]
MPLLFNALSGQSALSILTNHIADTVLAELIQNNTEMLKHKIDRFYRTIRLNLIISIIETLILILLAILYLFTEQPLFLYCISVIIIVIMTISMIRNLLNIKLIFENRREIIPRVRSFIRLKKHHTLSDSIKNLLRNEVDAFYYKKTNKLINIAHGFLAKIHLVKSKDAIEDEIVAAGYALIMDYVLKVIGIRIISIFLFYAYCWFFLVRYVFTITVRMTFLDLMLFPFVYVIPHLWTKHP